MDPLVDLTRLLMVRRAQLLEEHNPNVPAGHAGLSPKEGLMTGPVTNAKQPIEWKVKAASLGTYLATVAGLAVLQALDGDHSLIAFLPDPIEAITLPLIPTGIAWLAGYKAKHTARPDLPQAER